MTLRNFVSIVAVTLILSAGIGYARAETTSTAVAAKKAAPEKTTSKKAPSHRVGRGVVVIYSAPRDPVSFNGKGEATLHIDMAQVMAAVDLDAAIPVKVAINSPKPNDRFEIAVVSGE